MWTDFADSEPPESMLIWVGARGGQVRLAQWSTELVDNNFGTVYAGLQEVEPWLGNEGPTHWQPATKPAPPK